MDAIHTHKAAIVVPPLMLCLLPYKLTPKDNAIFRGIVHQPKNKP